MPRYTPVNILGGCYADSDRAWSLQDTVNWLPEQAEQPETRTPTQFKTPPGLRGFVEVTGPNASKPVRQTYNCEGKLFAAIGKGLYQITNSGVAIEQGTIPGNTRVTMTHNQISQGNQLVAVNGSSGYVFNTLTQVYEKIVDEGFPGAIWVGFADGYIIGIEPGRRFAFNSEPADALNYNSLDRFTSEYKPDLIVTGIVNNNELILLNETSYEFFENTGASQQPFRSKRIYGDVGCASRFGACNLDRTVFMFGADGKFYRLEGYNWIRISTRPIEQAIRGLNWSQCFATVWEDGGHSVVRWTFPDGMTWCFDQSTQLWHRMKSLGLDRYRINSSTQLGQNWYCGDFQSGRIWVMDWDYILEGEDEIESERVTGVLSDNQNLAIVNRIELLFATGQELTVPVDFPVQPDPPTITGAAPDGSLGQPYPGFAYTLGGGSGNYQVSTRSGTLPPGLGSVSNLGVIAALGEPTGLGSYTFTLRNTDTETGLFADHADTIVVNSYLLAIGAVSGVVNGVSGSANGTSWGTVLSQPVNGSYLLGVADGRILSWNATDIIYSDDLGASWNNTTGDLTGNGGKLYGAYKPGFIIIADGISGFARSIDNGLTITKFAYPANPQVQYAEFNAAGRLLVASQYQNYLSYSTDNGTTWANGVNHGVTLSSGGSITSGGNYFAFCGNNSGTSKPKVVFTQDGITLARSVDLIGTVGTFVNAACAALIGDDYIWVFGVNNGDLYWTDDYGVTMTKSADTMAGRPNACKWNGTYFVMVAGVANDGDIKISTDGKNWTAATQPLLYYVEDIGVIA